MYQICGDFWLPASHISQNLQFYPTWDLNPKTSKFESKLKSKQQLAFGAWGYLQSRITQLDRALSCSSENPYDKHQFCSIGSEFGFKVEFSVSFTVKRVIAISWALVLLVKPLNSQYYLYLVFCDFDLYVSYLLVTEK